MQEYFVFKMLYLKIAYWHKIFIGMLTIFLMQIIPQYECLDKTYFKIREFKKYLQL